MALPLFGVIVLLIVLACAAAWGSLRARARLRGLNSETPSDFDSWTESEKLSHSMIPAPAESSGRKCSPEVEFSFDQNARETDLDKAIGPRVEKWECVHGARIRIVGTAKYTFKGGARVMGGSDEPFSIELIDDSKVGFEWPKQIEGLTVVVEGCLSRLHYPRELQKPDTSKWTDREKQTRNRLRAYPFGFVYALRNFTYRLADESAGPEPSERAPADDEK